MATDGSGTCSAHEGLTSGPLQTGYVPLGSPGEGVRAAGALGYPPPSWVLPSFSAW